jgi:hypothetical protein
VVFSSSKTPNLNIHHRDNDQQTANDMEAFFHQILYPLPNGRGLGKVRMYFAITTAINEGIHSIRSRSLLTGKNSPIKYIYPYKSTHGT